MVILILSNIILLLSIIFFFITNPVSMGVTVLILALLSTIIVGFYISSWVCFIVFLIYIRGILVLFSYFVAISPNKPIINYSLASSFVCFGLGILYINIRSPLTPPTKEEEELYVTRIWIDGIYPTIIFLGVILLLTIVIVVKVVTSDKEPLRPFETDYV